MLKIQKELNQNKFKIIMKILKKKLCYRSEDLMILLEILLITIMILNREMNPKMRIVKNMMIKSTILIKNIKKGRVIILEFYILIIEL